MKKIAKIAVSLSIILGVMLPFALFAGELTNLYQAEIPVLGQDKEHRQTALQTAMFEVLVRVSGNREIARDGRVKALLQNPDRFVLQFRYKQDASANSVSGSNPGSAAPLLKLWVEFDAKSINQVLQQANIPVWGRARPELLLWIVVEDGSQRFLISADSTTQLKEPIHKNSERRGLPVLYPLYDLEDQAKVRLTDILGNFSEPILNASARYRTDAILVGRLSRSLGNSWEGKWYFYQEGNMDQWSFTNPEINATIAAGLDRAIDVLASRTIISGTQVAGEEVLMNIAGIHTLVQLNQAQKLIKNLEIVGSLQVQQIKQDDVTLKINVRGTAQDFTRLLGRVEKLAAAPQDTLADPNHQTQILRYRLLQ